MAKEELPGRDYQGPRRIPRDPQFPLSPLHQVSAFSSALQVSGLAVRALRSIPDPSGSADCFKGDQNGTMEIPWYQELQSCKAEMTQ